MCVYVGVYFTRVQTHEYVFMCVEGVCRRCENVCVYICVCECISVCVCTECV